MSEIRQVQPLKPSTSLYSIIGDWGILLLFFAAITASILEGRASGWLKPLEIAYPPNC